MANEKLGKTLEQAVCLLYGAKYNGEYIYSMEEAHCIKDLLQKLVSVFPHKLNHVAKNRNRYDFETDDKTAQLSCKSSKKEGKVCPQVIGQPTRERFCNFFNIELISDLEIVKEKIKEYIQKNIHSLLEAYISYTFDCPIIYYNEHKDVRLFIKLKESIDWTKNYIVFSHILKNKVWNESSTISIDKIKIGEFQIHNHRNNVKFRWYLENILQLFKDNFEIVDLSL